MVKGKKYRFYFKIDQDNDCEIRHLHDDHDGDDNDDGDDDDNIIIVMMVIKIKQYGSQWYYFSMSLITPLTRIHSIGQLLTINTDNDENVFFNYNDPVFVSFFVCHCYS